jgi:hypothetical protein
MNMARISIFPIIVALIAGTVGCAGGDGNNGGDSYTLTVDFTVGGTVTVDDVPIPGKALLTYDSGTVVNLAATSDAGYRFVEWSGNASTIDDVNAASTTVTVNSNYSITANFIKQYDLTISSTAGGSVTMPGEATYAYDEGKVVNLVAQAEGGYHFVNWTGDVSTIANVNATITDITMSGSYIITANFAIDLYFSTDACVILNGPAILPPAERDPCVSLQIMTNIVMDSVRVDLPDGRLVIIPVYTDVFSPDVDWTTLFRFATCEPGMPTAGGEYIFTAFDAVGEPIPGAINTDIWVGVEPPDPPTNVRAELTEDGILVSWDESPIIPGSFEPAAEPQLGFYQLWMSKIETGGSVYGANQISTSSHLIPQDKADFINGKDWGLALSEMEDGTYCLQACVLSIAPQGSLGKEFEYNSSDPSQTIIFTIQDGEITIK